MEQQNRKMKYRGRKAVPMQYRRKRSWKKLLLISGGVLLLCVLAAILVPRLLEHHENITSDDAASAPDRVIHLVAGGNVNITKETLASGKTADGYNYQQVFKDVLPILSSGDITVLNFEGVMSGNQYSEETKNAPPELMNALKNAGVDILQTANSYSVYDGHQGMISTIQGIQKAGMTPLGTYASQEEAENAGGYLIWEVKGVKVAMMAFTKGMVSSRPGIPEVSKNCINLLYEDYEDTYQKVNSEGIRQVVRNAAAHEPDVMIALVHWGGEGSTVISKTQEKIRDILHEEGVDAIIGTHPHNVQKMDWDRDAETFVAWSLGDFYGNMADNSYSILLDLEITKDGKTGQTKVTDVEYVPIYMHEDENGNVRLLRINEAVAAYENRYLDRVSEETYNAMKNALESIKSRMKKK